MSKDNYVYKGLLKPLPKLPDRYYPTRLVNLDELPGCCGVGVLRGFLTPYDTHGIQVLHNVESWLSGPEYPYYIATLNSTQEQYATALEEYFGFQLLEDPFIGNHKNHINIMGLCTKRYA